MHTNWRGRSETVHSQRTVTVHIENTKESLKRKERRKKGRERGRERREEGKMEHSRTNTSKFSAGL